MIVRGKRGTYFLAGDATYAEANLRTRPAAASQLGCSAPDGTWSTEPGDPLVREKNGDGTDPALAEAKAINGQIERHALRIAQHRRSFFGSGEVAPANQGRRIGASIAQEPHFRDQGNRARARSD